MKEVHMSFSRSTGHRLFDLTMLVRGLASRLTLGLAVTLALSGSAVAGPALATAEPAAGGALSSALSGSSSGATQTGCPSWWADGTGLIYCQQTGPAVEIWEVGTGGGEPRRLTYVGGVSTSPDLSPDGSLVAFDAAVPAGRAPQVFVIEREGTRGRTVLVGSAVIRLEGARPVQLTTEGANFDPVWSADGDRIAFVSDRTGEPSLWVMNADGSEQTQVLFAVR
jgi:hypothetical protein